MKLWYVTMVFPTPSETFLSTEVEALRSLGVNVSVHAMGPPRSDASELIAERHQRVMEVTHGDLRNVLASIVNCVLHPLLVASLMRLIFRWARHQPRHVLVSLCLIPRTVQLFLLAKRERPDVIHLYWGHYPSLLGHLILQHLPSIVLSLSLSAYDLRSHYGCSIPVARQADLVRTWARVNVDEIKSMGVSPDRIGVFYQPLDCARHADATKVSKVKGRVVSAGRLIPEKGMTDVLAVFRQLVHEWPQTSLVILGDGPERSRLEQQVERWELDEVVSFQGHIPHERVLAEMASADVFLFMSYHDAERLPNVVKEAIAVRCLCIVSETPGIEELVVDGESGFIVPQRDIEQAVSRLRSVFSSADESKAMTAMAFERLHENFDSDSVVRSMIGRWEKLRASKSGEEYLPGAQ